MASVKIGYRTAAVGITSGLGLMLPLAAYAVSLPYEPLNDLVRSNALPLSAGMLLGAGTLALTGHVLDARAERREAEEAEAAQFSSIFSGEQAVPTRRQSPQATGVVARQTKGVPVIARAVDALDEAEAWAEIDAMFSDGSPISCDPSRSKDMYQIALEELMRTERTRAQEAKAKEREEREEASARNEAMEYLYGAQAVSSAVHPAAASEAQAGSVDGVLTDSVQTVPMADYSGHEDMWASALAILSESDTAPSAPASASVTSSVARDRMAAVAEGGNETRVHSRVNRMIEEEFDRVGSKSVRATTHEFLRVIEGGTASMPAFQQAEA